MKKQIVFGLTMMIFLFFSFEESNEIKPVSEPFICSTKSYEPKIETLKGSELALSDAGEIVHTPQFIGSEVQSLIARRSALWSQGNTLRVRFLNGKKEIHDKVIKYANEWSMNCNIKFSFNQHPEAPIRINFEGIPGTYNSYVGTDALGIPSNSPTMNLVFPGYVSDAEIKRTVIHEFGHAIGLKHEHQHPEAGISWNKNAVYEDLERIGWRKEVVDYNIFRILSTNSHIYGKYDPNSIMHYPIPRHWTTNGYSVNVNFNLSQGDKEGINKYYPVNIDLNRFSNLGNSDYKGHFLNLTAEGDLSLVPSNDKSSGSYWRLTDEGSSYLFFNWGNSNYKGWYLNNKDDGKPSVEEKVLKGCHWSIIDKGDHVLIRNLVTGKFLNVKDHGDVSLEDRVYSGCKWKMER